MAEIIRMPKMSDTMTEGVIAAWNKNVGDKVKSGDILAEVETDKATMDMESYYDGVLLYVGVEKGQAVPVDAVVAIIGEAGESYQHLLNEQLAVSSNPQEATNNQVAEVASKSEIQSPQSAIVVNATAIRMPKMSDTMLEGEIVSWLKKVGDKVKSGDILAEVNTDKATMELDAYEDGTLLYIGVEAGKSAKVDDIIAIIGEEGADYKVLLAKSEEPKAKSEVLVSEPVTVKQQATAPQSSIANQKSEIGGRVLASPLAKRLADEKGINITDVNGSGEGGRIIKKDIDGFVPSAKVATGVSTSMATSGGGLQESYEDLTLSQMRKTIARRLAESKFSAPEFYLTMEINMDKAIAARTSMNELSPVKISFNDMVIKAVSMALTKHAAVNSAWLGDKIRKNHHVHIGMAVAVEEGLLVPVIRFANTKTLSQIAAETKDLGGKAKNKQLQPKDWEGNTFTVSNLGMFGIDEFTSIINPPESCIMAVGGIKETVAVKDGQFYATNIMKVTLTCDHRVVDGATGAQFLVTFKQLLDDPIKMLV